LQDTEIGGRQVRHGDSALVVLGAANRDPAVFAEPDRLDLTRQPNPHLQFGYGQHSCGGMSLARLEMRLTFATLAGRAHSLTVMGDPEWKGTVSSRGLTKLPVSLR
jgi:cytochrome P450